MCQRHAVQLGRIYEDLQSQDTTVLVIGSGSQADAARLVRLLDLPFPVLADSDRSVYRSYGLDKAFFIIQRSATVLVDKQGRIRYVHRATNPNHSLDEAELLAAIERI